MLIGLGFSVALTNIIGYYSVKDASRYYRDSELSDEYMNQAEDKLVNSRSRLWGFGLKIGEWYWYRRYLDETSKIFNSVEANHPER